jgi:small subunit ribosomal protein S3
MGQKVHPLGFRLGYIKTWDSKWYAEKEYAGLLHEDLKVRRIVKAKLYHAGVSKVEIDRSGNQIKITIQTARPGIIIGRKGIEVDKLKSELEGLTKKQVYINIKEIKKPELDAQLVAENIATQLEKRIAYRRAMKKAVASTLRLGGQGIKVACAGRLAGSEIARTEWYREGRVPLHTLRADIDFGLAEASTTYGKIGVKVWIYRGEILPEAAKTEEGRGKRGFDRGDRG